MRDRTRLGAAALTCAGLMLATLSVTPASAWDRGIVETFAVLPAGTPMIEGLTVGRDGNVYVTTFDPASTTGAPALLFVFNDNGELLRRVTIAGSSPATLGLAFHPTTHALLVVDFGAAKVLNVDPNTGTSSVFMTVPTAPPPATGLNALTFDAAGNVYVSDSFQGIIWKTGPGGGLATAWVGRDPLLQPHGVPGFGANGLQFNKHETALFVANTADDLLVKIPVTRGTPGTPEAFTYSINGADGIVLDRNDNIWAVANQADEIVVVDPSGKAIAKLGDFDGVENGVTRGLLFPASPDFSKDGKWLFVTNLELDLRSIGGPQTVDSQWAAQVQRHSIAKLRASIPPIRGE